MTLSTESTEETNMAENGTVAYVSKMPECDVCKYTGTQSEKDSPALAIADVKTKQGPWAYVCQPHRETRALYADYGVGKGQMLVVREQPTVEAEAG
jgi:hypothetical protein